MASTKAASPLITSPTPTSPSTLTNNTAGISSPHVRLINYEGKKGFRWWLNTEKSVHAAHIYRISVSPKQLKISDDKTGSMNLEIRRRRQTGVLTPEDEKILAAKLITKLKSPGIDHPTNTKLGMTVNCTTIDFDSFKVFR